MAKWHGVGRLYVNGVGRCSELAVVNPIEPDVAAEVPEGWKDVLGLSNRSQSTWGQAAGSGHSTTIFSNRGYTLARQDQLGLLTSFTQDANGNDILRVDARNWPTTYTVDALNRTSAKLYMDGTRVTNTWDASGQQLTCADTTGTTSWVWDLDGRKTATQNPTGINLTSTLDAVGNRLVLADPYGRTTYTHDSQSRLLSIQNPANERTTLTWDALDREQHRVLGNGGAISHTWDAAGRETLIENRDKNGVGQAIFSNTYDALSNRLSVLELDGTRATFSYDAASQLVAEARGGTMAYASSYVWDPLGNRIQQYDSGVLTTGTFNKANQLLVSTPASGPATTTSYDAVGNTIGINKGGALTTQIWTPENRLASVALPDGTSESYQYSDDGLRKKKTNVAGTTVFTWDESNLLLETDTSNALQARNTDFPGYWGGLASQRRGSTSSYYGCDSQGSVRILVSSAGLVTDSYSYKANGEPLQTGSGNVNPFLYIGLLGYYCDRSGIYYVRARVLMAFIARWLNKDPIGFDGVAWNLYEYAANSPVVLGDPTGLQFAPQRPPWNYPHFDPNRPWPGYTPPPPMHNPPQIDPITGRPQHPWPVDPRTGGPLIPLPASSGTVPYGPLQPYPSYGSGMYIVAGCNEVVNVRAGLQQACEAISSGRGKACIDRLSSGYRSCISKWCHSRQDIFCGSQDCSAQEARDSCVRGKTSVCNDITVCTSNIGRPECWNEGVDNVIQQIAKTLIHEAVHTCGIGDSARDTTKDPFNPAEDIARCIMGLPGHAKHYD